MGDILTIFTPTYNRGYLLHHLYDSLTKQSSYQFEWLIIDDASNDRTEEIVTEWKEKEVRFPIRYYKQKHGGKHRAINKALEYAEGDFFFIVDSDDKLTSDAVEFLHMCCADIKENKVIAGVAGLKISNQGKVWGGCWNAIGTTYIDASNFDREKYGLLGDKAEVYRTEILRKHRFPEFSGEYFLTEDVCWMRIAAEGYKIRWYNKAIYICDYLEDGLTKTGANSFEGHRENYKGYCYYIIECLKYKPFGEKMKHLREYDKTASRLNKSFLQRAEDIEHSLFHYLVRIIIGIPFGYICRKLSGLYNKKIRKLIQNR